MATHPVFLKDLHADKLVEAELVDAIEEAHLDLVDADWAPAVVTRLKQLVDQGRTPADWPQSWHWNWRNKMDRIRGLASCPTYAILCEGKVQGLMQLNDSKARCRIAEQAGLDLVYVDFVESAPWNRSEIVDSPRFKGVGSIMLAAAIETSRDLGFKGRIGLHSLPRSEPFYARSGMTDLGIDGTSENLKYFEMTPDQAAAFSK
ncbi:MAG: GNAT family N-acetyltransferase [Pseudomonadota bacterium]